MVKATPAQRKSSSRLEQSPLDDSQRAFCLAPGRAVRLLAPAGSGKTYSLLWRCLHLLETTVDTNPRFLIFTFTRAARDELRDRLKQDRVFGPLQSRVEITTLNSWGFRRLKSKMYSLKLCTSGADQYFCMNNVLQPAWQQFPRIRDLLAQSRTRSRATRALSELSDTLKTLGFRHDVHVDPESFQEHCEWLAVNGLRSQLLSVLKTLTDLEIVKGKEKPLSQIYEHYMRFWIEACARMYQSSLISFEDQKYWALVDLEQTVRDRRYTTGMHRFDHILVDEFQDINTLDLNLLKTIAEVNKSELTIVGDDDQAIYEWRGATPRFILSPDECIGSQYTSCILEVNYRSPRNIVEYSQKLIKNNRRRVDKNVRAASDVSADIDVLLMPTLTDSVNYVLTTAKSLLARKDIDKIALIGRRRSQIIPYQIIFASENMPFYAAEDLQIFLSDAFNDLKELLAIRARARMSGIFAGDPVGQLLKLADKVKRFPLSKNNRSELQRHLYRSAPKSLFEGVDALRKYTGPLKGENNDGRMSQNFAGAIKALLESTTVTASIDAISECFDGLQKDYGKGLEDIFYTDPPFLYLSEYAERYGADYEGFYTDIEKAVATLAKIPPEDDTDGDENWKAPLHLMTALRAKGKEFDAVILLDVNDGVWPSKLAIEPDQKEQERRIFYVGFTRARKRLIALVNETILGTSVLPSPYLAEMGLEVVRRESEPA